MPGNSKPRSFILINTGEIKVIKKILICDDQELICQVLSGFLRSKGFDVRVTSSSYECLQLVGEKHYDAIIMDIGMPEIDGVSLLKSIKNKAGNSRFILISGQVSEEAFRNQDLPNFQFFKKPFSLHAILESLKSNSKVLVVDDQDSLRDLLCDYLKQKGFETKEAKNGAEAVCMATKQPFDSILMDVRMPETDGITALREIQNEGVETPVVLMSGFGDVASQEDARALGARDFLAKPFKLDAVSHILAEIE